MQASTTVTSLVAAAALVGAIGLAYAQTGATDPMAPQAQTGTAQGMPNNTMNNTNPQPQTMPPQTQASPDMGAQAPLPPQADRN
ncbi:MAG TPA: hypothetical protein VMS38_18205 [Pseudorhodoferax sp.]|nr:hypothetical protein [Pseudorhodoferax sp.]